MYTHIVELNEPTCTNSLSLGVQCFGCAAWVRTKKAWKPTKKKYTSLPFPTTLAEPSVFITTAFVTIVLLLVSLGWDISGMVGISSCATGIRVMMVGWATVSSWSSGVWSRSGVASILSVWHCKTSTVNGLCFSTNGVVFPLFNNFWDTPVSDPGKFHWKDIVVKKLCQRSYSSES